jgi:predicted nucleic acid-binding protein
VIAVVDASVGAKWLFPTEERADVALDLLQDCLIGTIRLQVPPLFRAEVGNVVRQRMRREGVSLGDAEWLIDRLLGLPVTIAEPDGLVKRALVLATQYDLPAIYDAHYLALAEFAGCDLWTDDRRLLRHVDGGFPALRWIGEFRP